VTLVRAAVVQAAPVPFDLKASLDKVEPFAGEAADADIVVFPEAFLSAYPRCHMWHHDRNPHRRRPPTVSPVRGVCGENTRPGKPIDSVPSPATTGSIW